MILMRLSITNRKEVKRCKKIINEELHNLYSSENVISSIMSRTVRWFGDVARRGR
jgi:hypothetical protein